MDLVESVLAIIAIVFGLITSISGRFDCDTFTNICAYVAIAASTFWILYIVISNIKIVIF
ncbi:MAG: hypothetical protein IKB30_02270 [Clostridia bacterium]|nr:hypothetical protein [Clostridia bacterium]